MATSKHRVTPEVRLKRFLYTCCEQPKFMTRNPELSQSFDPKKIVVINEILQSENPELILNVVEIVNSENLAPRIATLYFTLAVAAASSTSDTFKHKIFTTLLNIIKTSEDLCLFLKFYTLQKKKFGTAVNKVICSYYTKKDPHELADEVTKSKGYHSWTHKDLLKLAHCKCECVLNTVVIHYILYGVERAKAVAESNAEAAPIIDKFVKVQELKRCENEKRIIELITELQCTSLTQIPSFYHHSLPVWEVLVQWLPLRDIIAHLSRLYKLGFLKANTPFQTKVVERLTNAEVIQLSHIHPVEVFIGLKNFEKGGKPIDPHYLIHLNNTEECKKDHPDGKKPEFTREVPKCPAVISALHKAMQLSFQNLQPTGRRFMITIDMTEKINASCLNNRNLTCLDAAVILTLSLLRVERDVTVAVFNESKVSIVSLEKHITINQAISKLKQAKSGYVLATPSFEWALNKKKCIDVFIHFYSYHHWYQLLQKEIREKEKPMEVLNKYRKKMFLPSTKLITFSLSSPQLVTTDGSWNTLDISGFNKEVPKVVEAFSKGLFY